MKRWTVPALALLLALLTPAAHALSEEAAAGLQRLDFREVIAEAKDEVFPAVVFIKCIREAHEEGRKVSGEVVGSGVCISADGEVLTNWHVVDKAVETRCLLYDGRARYAEVLGTDKDTDLALLQLKPGSEGEQFRYAEIGDSDRLTEGDFVMAMGAPWGLNRSVSIGIVSCTGRYLPDNSEYSLWLQTDASVSPGTSGGPLVDTDGKVVGITTRGALMGGDMGFAIPAGTVRLLLPRLREHGEVNWSWTGLQLQPLRDFKRDIYFQWTEGVMVAGTDQESPARRAGLKPRDRIIAIAGQPSNALTEERLPALRRMIGLLPKGETVEFDVMRDGKKMVVEITPREKGKVEGEELDCPRWDLTVKQINQFDNPDLHFYRKEGVFVYGVEHPGNAADAGLRERDILLKIGDEDVRSLQDVKEIYETALAEIEERHRLVFTVMRSGLVNQVVLPYLRDYEKE